MQQAVLQEVIADVQQVLDKGTAAVVRAHRMQGSVARGMEARLLARRRPGIPVWTGTTGTTKARQALVEALSRLQQRVQRERAGRQVDRSRGVHALMKSIWDGNRRLLQRHLLAIWSGAPRAASSGPRRPSESGSLEAVGRPSGQRCRR